MTIQYKAQTVQEIEAILAFWGGRGYTYGKNGLNNLTEIAKWYFNNYRNIVIYHNGRKEVIGYRDTQTPVIGYRDTQTPVIGYRDTQTPESVSFIDVFNIQPDKKVDVVLNDEYTAEVSKKGIKVGCQTFPLDIVEKLAAAKKEVLNS